MKNSIIFSVALLCFLQLAQAQIGAGAYTVGGDFNLTQPLFGPTDVGEITLGAKSLYFLADNFAVGGALESSHINISGAKLTNVILSPHVRYYVGQIGTVPFYSEISAGAGAQFMENSDPTFLYGLGAGIGADFFFNKQVALEPSLFFVYNKTSLPVEADGFLRFNIGFQVFFNRE